jgi:hypothetical protein
MEDQRESKEGSIMQRKIETKTRGEFFFERVVWNAAAGAALAVMVLILLSSLQWLDQFAPHGTPGVAPATPIQLARPLDNSENRSSEVAAINRPSG